MSFHIPVKAHTPQLPMTPNSYLSVKFLILGLVFSSCSIAFSSPEPCTQQWYELIEKKLSTGDGMGHGPDIASDEWKSVVEFKLGIRGLENIPERSSAEWCVFIEKHLDNLSI